MREDELVRLISRHVGPVGAGDVGIGDDAAVVGSEGLVICHDMMVEDVHFRWRWATPADVGHTALAANLSDIASMGASPLACVVGLAVGPGPLGTPAGVGALYDAMATLAGGSGCAIVGGDTSSSATTMVGVTVIGKMAAGVAPVLRTGGRVGDVVYVTGAVGGAAAGLAVLEGRVPPGLDPERALRRAQLRPTPRVAEGPALAAAGARAMVDCSDGLARDAGRLAAASGCGVRIDLDAVPRAPGVDAVAAALDADPGVFAATGGEDYELIAAFAPGAEPRGVALTRIGVLTPTPGVTFVPTWHEVPEDLGWEHRLP